MTRDRSCSLRDHGVSVHLRLQALSLMSEPIRLEAYSSRIDGVRVDAKLTGNDYQTASLAASVTIARSTKGLVVHAQLETASGDVVKEATLKAEDGEWKWDFEAGEVDAWWPIGYGKQPLYSLKVDLVDAVSRLYATQVRS